MRSDKCYVAAMNRKASPALYVYFLLACTVLMAFPLSAHAQYQNFTGNETTSGPFTSGRQYFYDNSVLNASAANSVSGGYQGFYDTSALNASSENAVSGGQQSFDDTSVLNASAANSVSGGFQVFYDTSTLNASSENAVSGGRQNFGYRSVLDASASNAISGGEQHFQAYGILNASAPNAISGGKQTFSGASVLNASASNAISGGKQLFVGWGDTRLFVSNAISGGEQTFMSDAVLYAQAANAISGGVQNFYDTSVLNASAVNAINGGLQTFNGSSVLNANAENAVTGGEQRFYETSVLNVSAANAINGGLQTFNGSSVLNALAENAISSSEQGYNDSSVLNANAANAVSGGQQILRNTSVLNANAANSVSGGKQYFYDTSKLNASVSNAISGGQQGFRYDSVLNASASNAISAGTQLFNETSVLNASVANAISGGRQGFLHNTVLNASAANAISGGLQVFSYAGVLSASAANAISGGQQAFRNVGVLSASAANAVSGGAQTFYQSSVLNVRADNALTNGVSIKFDNSLGGTGGNLVLNGHSTSIGGINSQATGSGIIKNGAAIEGTLTVDSSLVGSTTFSGLITDDGAGSLNLVKTGAGTFTLAGANNYTGTTTVDGGTLQAAAADAFSSASSFTTSGNGLLDQNGIDMTIASLNNGGMVATNAAGTSAGTLLTVAGDYIGNGGTLFINTELGNDASLTDRLVIGGDTSGSTRVVVNNVGGLGAPTDNGIKIIDLAGASNGDFSLASNYQLRGQNMVVAGAYAYGLFKNGVNTVTDGDWYLRSELNVDDPTIDPVIPVGPIYNPVASVAEAYPQILLGLNGLPTLRQRIGNRVWSDNRGGVDAAGTDAAGGAATPSSSLGISTLYEGLGVWGRIDAGHNSTNPSVSTTSVDYDYKTLKLQAGIDATLMENSAGAVIGGINVQYGRASANVSSFYGDGEINTNAYGFGGMLTWHGNNGLYVDGQAQMNWFDSDLSSDKLGSLVKGNDGKGYALSVETGKRIDLNETWAITPQAQLIYSAVDFDSFDQIIGGVKTAGVSLIDGDSLRARLGVALDRETTWEAENRTLSRSQVYGISNLYYEFLDRTAIDFSGVTLANGSDRLSGGIGIGGRYTWDNDRYSLQGEGSINTNLANFDSYELRGTVAFKVRW